jgi:hypothetical protein
VDDRAAEEVLKLQTAVASGALKIVTRGERKKRYDTNGDDKSRMAG